MKKLIILAMLFSLFASCAKDRLTANGDRITTIRAVGSFNEIRSSSANPVSIKYGNEFKAVLKGSSNLIPYFKTEVINNKLYLGYENARTKHDDIQIEVTLPILKGISLSGSGKVDVSGDFPLINFFNVAISGSGSILLANDLSADDLELKISGSGNMDLEKLATKRAAISISGSGDARVKAQDKIKANMSGSGNIYYIGNPIIDSHINGSGRITKVN